MEFGKYKFRGLKAAPTYWLYLVKPGFKGPDHVRVQGVVRIESGAYTLVREHFNSREMHLNMIKSMLNQALRDNAAIGH